MVSLIQKKQQQVNSRIWNTRLVSSHGLGKSYDKVHYSAQGQMELGRRFANAYLGRPNHLAQKIRSDLMSLLN